MKTKLPCDECRGKCCTYPAFTRKEFDLVKEKYSIPIFAKIKDFGSAVVLDGICPFLKLGRCSIYEHRPKGCKDYGMVPKLPCAYLFPMKAAITANVNFNHLLEQVK